MVYAYHLHYLGAGIRGLQLEASPGKKLVRPPPHLIQ
jgi:hypothetical protein